MTQNIPEFKDFGFSETLGGRIGMVVPFNHQFMYRTSLGSKIFEQVRDCHVGRFKRYDEYCKYHNIRYE